VPWHDAGWAGVVCSAPALNGACAKLKGIAAAKVDVEVRLERRASAAAGWAAFRAIAARRTAAF
jgi:hypothetical protein